MPDWLFPSYRDITVSFLREQGVSYILSDIDNTLVTYDDAEPTPPVTEWLTALAAAGIQVAFVSNNEEARVARFNRRLGYPAAAKAGKPGVRAAKELLQRWGAKTEETLFLGDQLLTDAACAHRLGIPVAIVPPIRDRTDWFHRIKRKIEVPYLRKYRKIHALDHA